MFRTPLSFLGSLGCALKNSHWAHWLIDFRNQSNQYTGYGNYIHPICGPYWQLSICVSLADLNSAEVDQGDPLRLPMIDR